MSAPFYPFILYPEPAEAVKVPSPRTSHSQEEVAKSLPTYVPNTPGRREPRTPRTPRQRKDSEKIRFYPVTKESSKPPDPQVRMSAVRKLIAFTKHQIVRLFPKVGWNLTFVHCPSITVYQQLVRWLRLTAFYWRCRMKNA